MKLLIIAFLIGQISSSIGKGNGIRGKFGYCLRDLKTAISCIQNLRPSDLLLALHTISWKIPLPEKFEGPLKVNTLLEEAQKLFENQFTGPESLALVPNRDIYTGTDDGTIYRISNDKLSIFVKLDGYSPKGIRYHRNGYLYVVADKALFQIFLNKTIVKVFGIEDMIFSDCNEKSSKFIDDLFIIYGEGTNGGDVIFIADISTKFPLSQFMYNFLEPDSTGRVIKYDINAKTFEVIMRDLWFPDGIEVNDAKNALLVSELLKRRILKHYIKGPNKGKTEVITSEIPGEPDNIRRSLSSDETYWVGINFVRNASNPLIYDRLSEDPVKRKLLLRAIYLAGTILRLVGNLVNFSPLTELGDQLVSGRLLYNFNNLPGMAIEIDSNGKILRTLQSPNNKFHSLSEVREVKNENNERTLYIGSAFNPYLGKLILNT